MKKKLYFGSNLKMYKNISQTVEYLQELDTYTKELRRRFQNIELFILPSFTSLESAVRSVGKDAIRLGAQNMCWEDCGKYTGEISPPMLKELGITLVMAGHSERRHIFGESSREENKKVRAALEHDFTALLCVGETEEEKKYGIGEEVLRSQLKVGLYGIPSGKLSKIWIAYEPVWSIGEEGVPASPAYAEKMHRVIKNTLEELFPLQGEDVPVFYGGSVNASHAGELIRQPSVDGLFVGRAAWEAKKFAELIEYAAENIQNPL